MLVPFTNATWNLGIFYWPFALFIIVGAVNAVNLTDGVDGLAASVTTVVALAFMISAKIMTYSGYAAFAAALAGGCLGFLVWNIHPAKVFMGDTGSLFLGGMVCALAFGINMPLLLVPFGIIYIIEVLSDIIQIISFKTTHKRVFKMAPIHHHFELCGWSEMKIVAVFSFVTLIFSVAGVVWLANIMN
jgi:phospho-N-acetylmuramoyl-pentapeptide-transferase